MNESLTDIFKDAALYNVTIPTGGFLAIVTRTQLEASLCDRIQQTMLTNFDIKSCVFCGDFTLVGVGKDDRVTTDTLDLVNGGLLTPSEVHAEMEQS